MCLTMSTRRAGWTGADAYGRRASIKPITRQSGACLPLVTSHNAKAQAIAGTVETKKALCPQRIQPAASQALRSNPKNSEFAATIVDGRLISLRTIAGFPARSESRVFFASIKQVAVVLWLHTPKSREYQQRWGNAFTGKVSDAAGHTMGVAGCSFDSGHALQAPCAVEEFALLIWQCSCT